ncbi:hypothetical protein JAAARDRAFT_47337 [Jaapia argillacea MUCL 33604]|uniref:Uncharacterized protein n=1 Tax=Jaapia argillacea MUCL 33604 TaxID=933084 RepID=A0A067Q3Y7_9AGAM|nr:hypothetical protein JAAARDRAFT_47337 [Jaapia argillacea MUCL 33604]
MTSDDILFFRRLEALNLKKLAFVACGLDLIQALGNWISSSSRTFNKLTADLQKEWIEILPCFSTITDIRLTITIPIPPEDRKLLEALCPNSDSSDASPLAHLQTLTIFIKCSCITGNTVSELDDMICLVSLHCTPSYMEHEASASSTNPAACLCSVHITTPKLNPGGIQQYIHDGLATHKPNVPFAKAALISGDMISGYQAAYWIQPTETEPECTFIDVTMTPT